MRKFKDVTGHEWKISLPFGEIERVRLESDSKFDLLDALGGELHSRLFDDFRELFELLAYLVGPQFEAANITAAEFGQRMAGACLVDARHAFFEEWRDFFQSLQRHQVAEVLDKELQLQTAAAAIVAERIKADPKLQALADQAVPAINRALDNAFSDLRDSLDSILNPTPGESSTSEPKENATNSEDQT